MPCPPLITFFDRPGDSPFIERVWQSRTEDAGVFNSIAACHWEMVVTRCAGKVSLTIRGPETRPTLVDVPGDGEWFAIRFKLGTYMPLFRPGFLRDLNDVTLPGATSHSFWLNGSAVEYPTFEHAETFVNRLFRRGIVALDSDIARLLAGEPNRMSPRTAERRFRQVTGLTQGAIHQIERARRATYLLRAGRSIGDVTFQLGYYDQAHLIHSLRRFVGQTPTEIIKAERQLSFLYNNTDAPA